MSSDPLIGARLVRNWLLHWLTAGLVILILVLALRPELSGLSRQFWMSLHLSAGWAVLFLTVLRLMTWLRRTPPHWISLPFSRKFIALSALALLFVCLVLGVAAVRTSPLGPRQLLFGLVPAPYFSLLGHQALYQVRLLHRLSAYGVLAVIILHGALGFIPYQSRRALPITWLWRVVPRRPRS